MSILIKGMEMPTSCWDCYFQDCGNCVLNANKVVDKCIIEDRIDENCPLVPVQPHGRLIDADSLYGVVRKRTRNWAGGWSDIKCVLTGNDIKNAPTIIPPDHIREATKMVKAEEGET